MLELVASGHYYADLDQATPLNRLRDKLQAAGVERYRRIDRFTELCLLGAARCRQHSTVELDARTGIYLGSGFAGIANTVEVQQQVFRDGQLPRPAGFINTLSNSAGYYVARSLGLQSQNFFLSRGSASLVAVLQMAAMDIRLGVVSQAMVGVVDESDRRLDWHRHRQGLAEDAVLAEGSHWFLLAPPDENGPGGSCGFTAWETLSGIDRLGERLARLRGRFSHIHLADDALAAGASLETGVSAAIEFNPVLGHYPSRIGGVMMAWLEQAQGRGLLAINGDRDGRFHLALLET